MDTYTPQEPVAPVAPQPKKQSPLWIIGGALILIVVLVGAWFFLFRSEKEPEPLRLIENGQE